MKKKLNELKDFVKNFDSKEREKWVRHYIANYIWRNIVKIECILEWYIKEQSNDKKELQLVLENVRKIELLLDNEHFSHTLAESHRNWKYSTNELLNLLNNK